MSASQLEYSGIVGHAESKKKVVSELGEDSAEP